MNAADALSTWGQQLSKQARPYLEAALTMGDALQVTLFIDADGKIMPPDMRVKARVAKALPNR